MQQGQIQVQHESLQVQQGNHQVQQVNLQALQMLTQRRRESGSLNSFAAIGNIDLEGEMGVEIVPRTPTTFLEVFEALCSRDKGKGVMGDIGDGVFVERGFSPTH
jgi:hypothetical protein